MMRTALKTIVEAKVKEKKRKVEHRMQRLPKGIRIPSGWRLLLQPTSGIPGAIWAKEHT
jgi:hypothetical protein